MKKNYKKLHQLPKNVMVLTNAWTNNQNVDAPASSGTVSVAAGATGVLNAESGVITITGLTAAAGARQSATVTNNKIVASSNVTATLNNYTGTLGTDGEPCLIQVSFTAGSMVIHIVNVDLANALAGAVSVSFRIGQVVR